ncbi:hypothetical protein D3C73_982050 [compost metagenome]
MLGQRRLGRVSRRHDQDAPRFGGGNGGGQRTGHRAQLAGQAQLAEELVLQQRLRIDLATGSEDAQGNREVITSAFLRQVGGRQVQGDAPLREIEARAEQGRPYALA